MVFTELRKNILLVDDEPDIVALLSYNLKKEGFSVDTAADGEAALAKIRGQKFDLVILDLMLPDIQGIDLCKMIRNNPHTVTLPIIMLTAKGEEIDKVIGLEVGADDYVTKPFSPRELTARIKAVLRRGEATGRERQIIIGPLVINKDAHTVTVRGKSVNLTPTEFDILLYLAECRGRVISRDQLLDAVWSGETFVEPRTVDVHIRRLRQQLEEDPAKPKLIKTLRGVGYYLERQEGR